MSVLPLTPTPTPTPPPPASTEEDTHVLPLTQVGLPSVLRLSGALDEYLFSVPVPKGWRPRSLHMYLSLPPTVQEGFLVVEQDGRVLGTFPLPEHQGRLSVSLADAEIQQQRLTLRFRTLLNPQRPFCAPALERWAEFREMEMVFTGAAEAPTTLADFWPPDLQTVRLFVPEPLTPGIAAAALEMAAFAARQGAGHGVQVEVGVVDLRAAKVPAPAHPFSRTVVLGPGQKNAVHLVPSSEADAWPVLFITGPEETLASFVARLTRHTRTLLFTTRAEIPAFSPPETPNLQARTLADLGLARADMQGSGPLEVNLSFSQGDFGGPIRGLSLRLLGTHTPVPPGGNAVLTVLLNGGLVAAHPLGEETRFDLKVTLPAARLRRDNTLTVRVLYTPPEGDCRVGVHDLMVHLDPSSTLVAEPGQHLAPGFARFPQALLPTYTAALEPLTPDTLHVAATVVAALQRLTATPLHGRILPWEQALEADGPLLAVTQNPEKARPLNPPLEPVPFRLLDTEGRPILTLDVDMPFATLQAFEYRGRDVLLWTHRNFPESGRHLARYLHDRNGWYDLNGDVWLWPKDAEPVSFRVRESGLRVQPLPETPPFWTARIRWYVFAGLVVLALAILVWLYPRLVQREQPKPPETTRKG